LVIPRDDADQFTLECAPTVTNGPVNRRGNIEPDINAWCDSLDLNYVTQDDRRREKVWSFGSSALGTRNTDLVFSANWDPDVIGRCPDRTRGTEPEDCKKAMFEVLDTCGGKD
jgi:hypothetical protein